MDKASVGNLVGLPLLQCVLDKSVLTGLETSCSGLLFAVARKRLFRTFYFVLPVFYQEMNRLESKKHSPAQVFAQFTSTSEREGIPGAKTNCKHEGEYASDNRREIQITESGEVSLPPDKARVSIVCSNAKVSDQYLTLATAVACTLRVL